MCLARSTPHTGSSGAQGLWSEFTAKPQLAAPKGSTAPLGSGLGKKRNPAIELPKRLAYQIALALVSEAVTGDPELGERAPVAH